MRRVLGNDRLSPARSDRKSRRLIPTLATLEERALLSITISLNYSLDTSNFFNTQAKRNLMQLAANSVASDLNDSLSAITPSGSNTWTATVGDPAAGFNQSFDNLQVPANTIVVYVLGAGLPGSGEAGEGITGGWSISGDANWANTVAARGQTGALAATPHDFGPWGGAILFDTSSTNWFFGQTTAGLTSTETDFLTVAEHEIGHVLGIGTAASWHSDISGTTFIGPASEAAHGGTPVPLDPGLGHWLEGTTSDGHPATMDPVLLDGTRNPFTTLDFAALQDVGWQVQAPVLQFATSGTTVSNNAGSVTLTVNRTGGTGPTTVRYTTSNGTAQPGVDYTAQSGTLNFANGQTSQTITIPILPDGNLSDNATFNVTLSSPTAGAVLGGQTSTTVTISPSSTPGAPGPPVLDASSDTGVSSQDRITSDNGSATAPLIFHVSGVTPSSGYVRLFDNGNLVAGPTQASNGTVTFTLAGTALPDGVHQFTATTASSSTNPQSAPSTATPVTTQTSLQVVSVSPADGSFKTSLPNGQIVVTFNHPLAGFTADDSTGAGFSSDPFAVILVPDGPDGKTGAPSGIDSGVLPIHATLVYHVNADGTSTITLIPRVPLATNLYAIGVSGVTDLAGNMRMGDQGSPPQPSSPYWTSFELKPSPVNSTPLKVTGVTTLVTASGSAANVVNAAIPQPDTLGIAFNKPLDFLTVDTSTVQLFDRATLQPIQAGVTYSPTTDTVYLTPEATLNPGTVYLIRVDGSVSDDTSFPNPGIALGSPYYTTFMVTTAGAGSGTSPLNVVTNSQGHLATTPGDGMAWTHPMGYAAIPFSEPVDMTSLGRYSVFLNEELGGLNSSGFDPGDVPLNAKLAFNPNLNEIILVPTVATGNDLYVDSVSSLKATNGDALTNPGGSVPVYGSFLLQTSSPPAFTTSVSKTAPLLTSPGATPVESPAPTAPAVRVTTAAAKPQPSTGRLAVIPQATTALRLGSLRSLVADRLAARIVSPGE